jgi:(S)-ureidoglycine aminohydrolase
MFPLEGYPPSRIANWDNVEVRILAAPAMGAEFVQYLVDATKTGRITSPVSSTDEWFFYIIEGAAVADLGGEKHELTAGSFCFVPPGASWKISARQAGRWLGLKKRYEPLDGVKAPKFLINHVSKVHASVYMGDEGALLQTLLPDELAFDMAMNIFEFQAGHSLPYVETHVMEHGLFFLPGKGLYYLDDTWMEVETTDFIWMGPFCPQSFYATGPVSSKYIYYKNVNRDIAL